MRHNRTWKTDIHEAIASQNHDVLLEQARSGVARVIRFLNPKFLT